MISKAKCVEKFLIYLTGNRYSWYDHVGVHHSSVFWIVCILAILVTINLRIRYNKGNKLEFVRSNMEPSSFGIFYARYIFTPILHRRFACRFLPLCTFVQGPFSFQQRTINSCGHWYAINVLASLLLYVRASENRDGQYQRLCSKKMLCNNILK